MRFVAFSRQIRLLEQFVGTLPAENNLTSWLAARFQTIATAEPSKRRNTSLATVAPVRRCLQPQSALWRQYRPSFSTIWPTFISATAPSAFIMRQAAMRSFALLKTMSPRESPCRRLPCNGEKCGTIMTKGCNLYAAAIFLNQTRLTPQSRWLKVADSRPILLKPSRIASLKNPVKHCGFTITIPNTD
jgi:hypothetical protein